MIGDVWNPAFVDPAIDSRAVTFENPTGERGAGGTSHGGRKGSPSRFVAPGERLVLADVAGPGVVRHIWMTFPPAPPERMRSLILEVFYDDHDEPSVSVPCLDFFGMPHGRPVAHASALTAAQEGRGFNSYVPMPFAERVRFELVNAGRERNLLYYQIDYTLHPAMPEGLGVLHASFRRENPTTLRRDFVIAAGLRGPGRFLGCNIGVRVIDECGWWGEGEVKVYRDGDRDHPTICGTGLEDYVGSAWGLGAHAAPYGGAPLVVQRPSNGSGGPRALPDYVGFYRWHVPDPIMFRDEMTVTIQQIGAMSFRAGEEERMAAYERTNPVAGAGWNRELPEPLLAWGIAERVDDFCATAYVYCTQAQPVPRCDPAVVLADIARLEHERVDPTEAMLAVLAPERHDGGG
ncbi:MAG: glycoside hydrolase family 172 protein [Actinomycetota bacterium]|nr:glycoside hydrolase family 172 protein [Actinomycetota bacterium]